jgi:hypothetical protein
MNTKTQKLAQETIVSPISEETALVNTATGEIIEPVQASESAVSRFTPFQSAFSAPVQQGIIYTAGHPRQYRADCKAGQFKIGESAMKGKEMTLEIISYRVFEAELFNYPHQSWLEVFFVDAENALSHILFKGISIENFITLYTDILIKRRSVGEGITTGRMEKRSNDKGDYYIVEFSWKENTPERVQELVEFAEVNALVNARFAQL